MSAIGVEREVWQERTGAFYPLVVAASAQTRLPIAGRLVPTDEDLNDALAWMPAIGLGLGVLWALVAASCLEIGLSTFASGGFVVLAIILCSGLSLERAAAVGTARGLARWRQANGQREQTDDGQLVNIGVVSSAIVLRTASLAALAAGDFTSALIAAAVLSRWSISLGPLFRAVQSSAQDVRGLWRYAAMAAAVAITMVLCQGASGLLLMIFAGIAMYLATRRASNVGTSVSTGLAMALGIEIVALLAQ